jgi:hypothetical protein
MARRYVRDNRGRFASVGATARGGRLATASGKKRETQTKEIAGGKPAGTIGKNRAAKPSVPVKAKAKPVSVTSSDVSQRAWRSKNRVLTEGKGGTKLEVKSTTQGGRQGHNINRVELREVGSNIGNSFEKTRQVVATATPYSGGKPAFRAGSSAGVNKWLDGSQKATAFGGRLTNGNRETARLRSQGRLRGGRGQERAVAAAPQRRRGNTTLAKLASPELRSLSQDRKIGYRELGNRKINRLMTAVRLENLTKAGKLNNYSPSQQRRAQSIHNDAGYTLRAAGGVGQNRRSITRAIRADRQRRVKSA